MPEWEALPGEAFPLTLAEYVPRVADESEQVVDWVLLAVSVTDVVGQVTVRPDPSVPVNVTVPAKLFRLVRTTPTLTPDWPELKS